MPHIKSLFRSLPSSTPTVNYYDWLLGRPSLKEWPDFPVHIDGVTGEQRNVHAVLERFEQAATALAASPSDGGLGLAAGNGGIVGILSENCLVRVQPLPLVRLRTRLTCDGTSAVKEFPVLTFALLKLAVPLAFVPAQSTLHETVALLKLVNLTSLFVSELLYPLAQAAAKEVGLPEDKIFILRGEVTGKASLPRLIDNVKARGLPRVPTQPVGDDTLAYLVFSSGTTGLPKGCYYFLLSLSRSF
jgi:acyl-CoA synthetase (AMP-forming)/AMP-acid ligase II